MYYQLSEDEFNSLEIVRDQLGLIAGLLTNCRDEDSIPFVTPAQLLTVFDAQKGAVARILNTLQSECQQRSAARAAVAESAVPQIVIDPELLMGLMDAASGAVNDSDTLLCLWDTLSGACDEHRPYKDVLHHLRDILRIRGLVIRTEFQDGECNRSFVMNRPLRETHAKSTIAQSRKRSQPATNA